jgi:hypothetical protein
MQGMETGGHLFMPAPVAASIGWPTSRFQWEVGLANVGYGVAGIMAPSYGREYILTKELWCGVKGHKLDKKYADGRRDDPYWACRRCGHVKERSTFAANQIPPDGGFGISS